MAPKFLSLQCISAAVDTEEDIYSCPTETDHIYANYSTLPLPPYPTSLPISSSPSSGICSGSDGEPEYDTLSLGYNLRSEQVFSVSPAPCPYQQAGCPWRGNIEHLKSHMDTNTSQHLEIMVNHTKKQAKIIKDLETKIEEAAISKDGVLIWKIANLSQKMSDSKRSAGMELVSRPFFSSTTGYKLQASLFLNGNGGGENTHISLYIKLLPGPHDCILKWPFRHTISFTLLDQTPDRTAAVNIMESFIPDQSWPNFNRPSTTNAPDQLGFGFPRFAHQDVLKKRGYIKDDTIFIKIRADSKKGVSV